jgi:hypothetical protein
MHTSKCGMCLSYGKAVQLQNTLTSSLLSDCYQLAILPNQ